MEKATPKTQPGREKNACHRRMEKATPKTQPGREKNARHRRIEKATPKTQPGREKNACHRRIEKATPKTQPGRERTARQPALSAAAKSRKCAVFPVNPHKDPMISACKNDGYSREKMETWANCIIVNQKIRHLSMQLDFTKKPDFWYNGDKQKCQFGAAFACS